MSVLHGTANGPVPAFAVGVHGDEFPPILAVQALADRIERRAGGPA